MKRLLILSLLVMAVLCTGFTLAPSRYTVTIPPGEAVDISYQIGTDSSGPFVVTHKADDTFNPLPIEWLSIPDRVKGDFDIKLSVPKSARPDNYSCWISVETTKGQLRAELCSRLLVNVVGEPVTPIPWGLIAAVAGIVVLVVVLVAWRRRHA